MRYRFSVFLFLVFILAGCTGQNREKTVKEHSSDSKLQIGLVFDVGGRGDKSFNDSAYSGLEIVKKKYGINFLYVEPQGEGADREAALRQMATDPDIGLVIGVGLLFSEDITRIAAEFPYKKFVCIDYISQPNIIIPANLQGIVFEEKKGSYLAGALAGMMTKTKTVGFIGGMESSVIKKFETGFIKGVRSINPEIRVISGYVGMTGSAFANPAKGRELALGQYGKGADIIYQAAGASGLGVIEAARERKALVICTDRDQESEAPGFVLSSMTKAVDRAVLKTVENVLNGNFNGGGVAVFGLADRYTDYVYNEKNASLIGTKNHEQLEDIRKKIVEGKIVLDETAIVQ
ncbi:MAG: BMP family ABC transporter substrate-binding protein [Chlorobiaceae bacterium]|jgi:basic membrane protein A and related proteins